MDEEELPQSRLQLPPSFGPGKTAAMEGSVRAVRPRSATESMEREEVHGCAEAGNGLDHVQYGGVAQQRENIDEADRNSCPAMSSLQSREIHQYEEETAGIIVDRNCHISERFCPLEVMETAKVTLL